MADKIIGLRINVVGTDDAVKKLSNIEIALEQNKRETQELNKQFRAAVGSGNQQEAEELAKKLQQLRLQQKELKTEAQATRKEIDLQQKAFRAAGAAAGSYEQLNAQLGVLRNQFKALSAAEREGEIGKKLTEDINKLDASLKQQDAQIGVFTRNVGNYEESVVRALRRVANEDTLKKELKAINEETDELIGANRKLVDTYEELIKAGKDTSVVTAQLVKNEDQIKKNKREAEELARALKDAQALGEQDGGGAGRVSGRGVRRLGKVLGGAGSAVAGAAGDLIGGGEVAARFGVAGAAAFGVFAAGGLAVKALSVLEELSKDFGKLENQIKAFGGASGTALKTAAVNVKGIATTFGKEQEEVAKAAGTLSKNLGGDFNAALSKLEQGFMTGADASGELLGALEGAAEGARTAGLSIDDLIVFSNEATQSGLISERGLELVNTFGTNIKTNSEEARTALQGALGKEFTDTLFKNVQDGSLSTKDAIQQVSVELGKQGVSAKQAAQVFTDAFGAQTAAENEFILGLNDTRKGIADYIDEANRLTNTQREQLSANKALASAQQGLAETFESFGFSLEAVGTRIKASLLNAANSAILFFNKTFGDGVAAAREEFRQLSIALDEQTAVVNNLETNYEPLLKRYDELTATLPTLKEGSDEAKAAQAELRDIVQKVGEAIPAAKLGIDGYSTSLALNAEAARGFIETQRQQQRNLENAQLQKATERYAALTTEINRLNAVLQTGQRSLSGTETAALASVNPLLALGNAFTDVQTAASPEDLIAANEELRNLVKELGDVEKFLAGTVTNADIRRRFNLDGVKTAAEEAANAQTEADKKAAADRDKANAAAQAKANKEAEERAKAAAEKAKQERERLLEEEKRTREALEAARKQTQEGITQLTIEGIENDADREAAAVRQTFTQRIEADTQGLRTAAEERIKTLDEIKKRAGSDAVLRAQFGSPAEIQQRIDEVNAQTAAKIDEQTRLLLQARDKQLKELQESRKKAVEEAARNLDAEALSAALSEVGQRLQVTQGELQKIDLQFSIDEQKLEQQTTQAQARLRAVRAAGLITEQEFAEESRSIAQQAEEARINLLVQRLEAERALLEKQAEERRLQVEGERLTQLDAIDTQLRDREAALQTQREQELITEEQYLTNLQAARESAQQARLLTEENAQQQIGIINEEFRAEQIAAEGEIATATTELYADTLEAYREKQQQVLESFAEAAQQFAQFSLGALEVVDQFAEASELRRREEIQQRYDAEIAGAQGNAQRIAAIEQRRAQEEERLEKQAAARRRAIAIAQATINGAVAITNILATTPDPTGFLTAARIALSVATTAAQIAVISAQPFAEGGTIPAGEGMITGRTHAAGGVRGFIHGRAVEVEGGEWKASDEYGNAVIINRHSTSRYRGELSAMRGQNFAGKRALLSRINEWGGGVRFAQGGTLAPPQIGAPSLGAGISQQQQLMEAMQRQIELLGQNLQATNQRLDRVRVVVDAQEVIEQGVKQDRIKQTQVL